MKSEKGITLTSLVIYVIGITIIFAVVANLTIYFNKNSRTIEYTTNNSAQITRLNQYLINDTKKAGKKVIAVGTTSCRTLESATDENGIIHEMAKETKIFIYPGYKFEAIDCLITNFHLPKSTLLMLISAFASKELIFKAYKEAVKEKYRFFSFGDSMMIL